MRFNCNLQVDNQSESLLLHPLVTGLLNYKWRLFGRYVYYSTVFLFMLFMILMNSYMLLLPLTYQLDWIKIFQFHRFLRQNRSADGKFVHFKRCEARKRIIVKAPVSQSEYLSSIPLSIHSKSIFTTTFLLFDVQH